MREIHAVLHRPSTFVDNTLYATALGLHNQNGTAATVFILCVPAVLPLGRDVFI